MMKIQVTCECGKPIKADSTLAGRRGKCPYCGAKVSIPALMVKPVASPAPAGVPANRPKQQRHKSSEVPVEDVGIVKLELAGPARRGRLLIVGGTVAALLGIVAAVGEVLLLERWFGKGPDNAPPDVAAATADLGASREQDATESNSAGATTELGSRGSKNAAVSDHVGAASGLGASGDEAISRDDDPEIASHHRQGDLSRVATMVAHLEKLGGVRAKYRIVRSTASDPSDRQTVLERPVDIASIEKEFGQPERIDKDAMNFAPVLAAGRIEPQEKGESWRYGRLALFVKNGAVHQFEEWKATVKDEREDQHAKDEASVPSLELSIPPGSSFATKAEGIAACRSLLKKAGTEGIPIWIADAKTGRNHSNGLLFTEKNLDAITEPLLGSGKYCILLSPVSCHIFLNVQISTAQIDEGLRVWLTRRGITVPGQLDIALSQESNVVVLQKSAGVVRFPDLNSTAHE